MRKKLKITEEIKMHDPLEAVKSMLVGTGTERHVYFNMSTSDKKDDGWSARLWVDEVQLLGNHHHITVIDVSLSGEFKQVIKDVVSQAIKEARTLKIIKEENA